MIFAVLFGQALNDFTVHFLVMCKSKVQAWVSQGVIGLCRLRLPWEVIQF